MLEEEKEKVRKYVLNGKENESYTILKDSPILETFNALVILS